MNEEETCKRLRKRKNDGDSKESKKWEEENGRKEESKR